MRPSNWLFLLLLPVVFCLECFSDEQFHSKEEEIIYGMKTVKTRNTTSRCVIFRGQNETHQMAYRGIWEAWQLPTDCLQYGEHCFLFPNFNQSTDVGTWAGCCCNKTKCNDNEEGIYMFYPEAISDSFGQSLLHWLRTFLYLCAFLTVPIWITAAGTFVYVKGMRRFQKQAKNDDYKEEERRKLNCDMEEDEDSEETARKMDSPHIRPSTSNRAFRVRKKPSRRQPSSSNSLEATTPLAVASTPQMTPLVDQSVTALTPSRASSLEVTNSTQRTQFSKIQRTPVTGIQQERVRSVRLSNGRVQHVSMQEDDEWED